MTLSPTHRPATSCQPEWLARSLNWLWLPLLLVLVPPVMDFVLQSRAWPRWFQAILDESGHAATTLVLFLALANLLRRRVAPAYILAVLAGGILIDVDHIPAEVFGSGMLMMDDSVRPYSHSVATLLVLVCAGLMLKGSAGQLILPVGFGVSTHLLRDLATGGLPLFWPLASVKVEVPYSTYLLTLVLAACFSAACLMAARKRFEVRRESPLSQNS